MTASLHSSYEFNREPNTEIYQKRDLAKKPFYGGTGFFEPHKFLLELLYQLLSCCTCKMFLL